MGGVGGDEAQWTRGAGSCTRYPQTRRTPPLVPGPQESVRTAGVLSHGPGSRLSSVRDAASAEGLAASGGRLTEACLQVSGGRRPHWVPGAFPRIAGGLPAWQLPQPTAARERGPGGAGLRSRQSLHTGRLDPAVEPCQGRESGCWEGEYQGAWERTFNLSNGLPCPGPQKEDSVKTPGRCPRSRPSGLVPLQRLKLWDPFGACAWGVRLGPALGSRLV